MIKIDSLPLIAIYDYTDIFGTRHYHTDHRHYLVDGLGRVESYTNLEYEQVFYDYKSNYQ